MKIILLGAPGSGKGTLAKKISRDFGLPQISTGDLFRAIVKLDSPLANRVKEIMASGGLVPDEITIEMVKDRIEKSDCEKGFILDGFPRTVAQAKALEDFAKIDSVILVELPNETIIERLSSRRTCPKCGEIYSIEDNPEQVCKKCNTPLIQRDDDKPDTIKHRLEVYETSTAPLINFYSDRLFKVSSAGTPEETYKPVKTFLNKVEA
mgnify:FL=1